MPITIIATYAQRQQYKTQAREEHWRDVQETIRQTPKSRLVIWGADSNGQPGSKEKNGAKLNKIIGQNAIAGKQMREMADNYKNTPRTKHDTDGHLEATIARR